MKLEECIQRVEKYLQTGDCYPRFVNVQNISDMNTIRNYFAVENQILPVSAYANQDENLETERLLYELSTTKKGNIFITGLTSQLKLQGEQKLREMLLNLAEKTVSEHVVILCYQCEKYLKFRDSKLNRLVYLVEGSLSYLPEIVFSIPEIAVNAGISFIDGIQNLGEAIEKTDGGILYVNTRKHKQNYPESLLYLKEESNAFQVLCHLDSMTYRLSAEFGTEAQWDDALDKMHQFGSWGAVLEKTFGTAFKLHLIANQWRSFDNNQKWLYFIGLKLNGAGENKSLHEAVKKSDNYSQLIRNIYRGILEIKHTDKEFSERYDERKKLISDFGISEREVSDYLQMVKMKEKNALYYLTDLSRREKEAIFELLDQYAESFDKKEIMKILSYVYPDLYDYLQPYQFRNELLNQYFQDYKYQKVINKIFPKFLQIVEEQAKKREYNRLPLRSEKLESLNKNGSRLYFVDALGVEYLSFILANCRTMQLMADISICRCELPSITSQNKEFLKEFENIAPYIKRLDEIKHHGEESFDYQTTKLPVHLIRELEIITDILKDIHDRLNHSIERAYIISDHGASRLSVIYENECQWKMASKGEHSGRCCPINEADVRSEYAAKENNFWVLANYDRFKGGRQMGVEVHGGASLEEVVVPIIELTAVPEKIEIQIVENPITVSYRKKAEIKLFSKTKLCHVTVRVNETEYDTEQQGNFCLVRMPDIKKAGTYQMTVFSNQNQVAELKFTVKKESSSEKSIL